MKRAEVGKITYNGWNIPYLFIERVKIGKCLLNLNIS